MKQVFCAEAIGLSTEHRRRLRWDSEAMRRERRRLLPRVEELTGLMLSGAFSRRRLKATRADYTHANARGTRGVWLYWTLECGPLYEARYRTGWEEQFTYRWLTVAPDGRLLDITEEEAAACLRNAHWASTS